MRQEIQDLLAKKDFAEGLLKIEDPSKVKDYFATEGNLKDVTDEEVKELGLDLGKLMKKVSELPKDQLEKISGGAGGDDDFSYLNDLPPRAKDQNDGMVEYGPRNRPKGYKEPMSNMTKAEIGVAGLAVLATAGAGIYKFGKNKGWWGKVK